MLQPKVLEIITGFLQEEIITGFLQEDENNYKELRNNLSSYKNIFQYVYSNFFPEIYCSTENRSFDLKINFHIIFKAYKDKEQLESSLGKNPENYEPIGNETDTYEQNPIIVYDFNEVEEREVKEIVEKRKQKRQEVAKKKKKLLKKKRKQEESKTKEKEMWKRLGELNQEFKEIKKSKKDSIKMSGSIIKM